MEMRQCRKGDIVCHTINIIKMNFCNYCRRKTYAQASMDIALLVVNAAHLTKVLRGNPHDNLRMIKISLISVSIVLEVLIAILLFLKERYDLNDEKQNKVMDYMNDIIIYIIFASVLVHVFVSLFVVDHAPLHYWYIFNKTE
uniref:Ninjurin-1 n=1 Tax=Parasteatoda tepidariorum TaxID=114398 RepID=A0A2L2YUM6_PARTP